jgi:glutamine synthetase
MRAPESTDKGLSPGRLTLELLAQMVDSSAIDTVIGAIPDGFGRLLGKRFDARFFLDQVVRNGFSVTAALLFSYDVGAQRVPNLPLASDQSSLGDVMAMPDIATLRVVAWLERTAIVLCDAYQDNIAAAIAPRSVLLKQVKRAAELGFIFKAAAEVEFYLFRDSYDQVTLKGYTNLSTSGVARAPYGLTQGAIDEPIIHAIRRHCQSSGIPVEGSHVELGPGQHEINLHHSEPLEMADRVVLYKNAVKEIARQHSHSVTFMAKWDESHIGSSMHIHLSLWDRSNLRPLFAGDDGNESLILQNFLGGLIKHAREVFAFGAPYPSSYKRFQTGGTAGLRIAWGHDNRQVSFRIVGGGSSLRIECRAPGADANPYLVLAAIVASGLDGIENSIEPPSAGEGEQLPSSLDEALHELRLSTWSRSALGAEVIAHYLRVFDAERLKFSQVVTSWERARYFATV